MDALQQEIEALKRRLDALEGGHVFRAPFQAVDQEGKRLLTVDRNEDGPYLILWSPEGKRSVVLWIVEQGGNVHLFNRDQVEDAVVTLYATSAGGALELGDREG